MMPSFPRVCRPYSRAAGAWAARSDDHVELRRKNVRRLPSTSIPRSMVDLANVATVDRVDAASRRMLRARDKMDRSYDKALDIAALARVALTSEAHFIRTFKETFGETPHRYLQRRRMERAMALLRETERPVT